MNANSINRFDISMALLLLSCFSRVRLCVTPWTTGHQAPCPWDSPGKNTGVGCHFLLQCTKVKRESEVAQSCPTLRDPMDCSLPGFSIHGIFQARVLEWGAIAFSRWNLKYNKEVLRRGWGRQWHPTPVLLPGKSHGRRSLVGCSPWGL